MWLNENYLITCFVLTDRLNLSCGDSKIRFNKGRLPGQGYFGVKLKVNRQIHHQIFAKAGDLICCRQRTKLGHPRNLRLTG